MYSFNEYWNDKSKKYIDRWGKNAQNFSKPWLWISAPLDQYRFVMTRLDEDKKPYPVDVWGNPVNPEEYGTTSFRNAKQLWVDGQNAFFDGYSIVLDSRPNPVYVKNETYYIVAGIYENCVTWDNNHITFSNEFIADRIALNYPTMWFTPDRRGMCWAGLSRHPILGGKHSSKIVSSYDLIIPITSGFFREDTNSDLYCNSLEPLPEIASHIISKWFVSEGSQR